MFCLQTAKGVEYPPVIPLKSTKIVTSNYAAHCAACARAGGQVVVTTNGCFDLLHVGHVRCLQQAKEQGDVLIVGLNSDASVQTLKGPSRPVQSQDDRAEILAALTCVDMVVIFDETLPLAFIEAVRPVVHVKGGDYVAETLPEYELLRSWGGRVVIVPLTAGRSTTRLLEQQREGT
jgi:rfaE bifunctional protein nucleotidyltransferase chain/domain